MLCNLNQSYIQRLPFAKKGTRYEVRDKLLPGLTLRVGPKRKSFYWHTRVDGKAVKIHLGIFGFTTTDQARMEVHKLILQSREGTLPPSLRKEQSLRSPSPTLQFVLDEYLSSRKLRQTSIDSYLKIARLYLADLMTQPVIDITSQDCMKLYQGLRDSKSPAKANDAIRLLNALMTYAKATYDVEVCQVKAKLKAAKLLEATPARDHRLTPQEIPVLLASLSARPLHYQVMIKTALLTGMRRAELQKLTWKDLDETQGTLLARDTKNHKDHLLPIGPQLLAMLMSFRPVNAIGPIFPARIDRWAAIVSKTSGIHFSLHALRRTFISTASKLLGNPLLVKALVNHSTSDVTERNYVRFELEDLRECMEKIELHLLKNLTENKISLT